MIENDCIAANLNVYIGNILVRFVNIRTI